MLLIYSMCLALWGRVGATIMKAKRKRLSSTQKKKRADKRQRRAHEASVRAADEEQRQRQAQLRAEKAAQQKAQLDKGYALYRDQSGASSCEAWWPVWTQIKAELSEDMRRIADIEEVFPATDLFRDWIHDFVVALQNASRTAPQHAEQGIEFCKQILQQFSDEGGYVRQNFRTALGGFYLSVGNNAEGERVFAEYFRDEPDDAVGYAYFGGALTERGWRDRSSADLQRARKLYEQAEERATAEQGYLNIDERLREIDDYMELIDQPATAVLLDKIPIPFWTEHARTVLAQTIADRQAPDRDVAVKLAGRSDVVNDDLVAALLAVAGNDEEEDALRGLAALALGPALEASDGDDEDSRMATAVISTASFERIQEELKAIYEAPASSSALKRRTLEASVCAPRTWHQAAVRQAHQSEDRDWRVTAMFCMGYVSGFEEEILAGLHGDDEKIRHHALHAAGAWGLQRASSIVVSVARDANASEDDRIAAIEALPTVYNQEAERILLELIDDTDNSDDIRDAARDAYAFTGAYADLLDE